MGDRTWLRLEFSPHDLDKFNEVLKDEICEDGGTWWDECDDLGGDGKPMSVQVYEADYGWYNEMAWLKNALLTFRMFHGAGGGYGSGTAACYMGEMVEMDTNHEDQPVVIVDKRGPDVVQVQLAREYFELSEKIDLYFKDDFRSHVMRAVEDKNATKLQGSAE